MRPNKTHIATTTLDIMWGQGLKYVHAITDGRGGVEGDLEKSKRKIKRYKETVRAPEFREIGAVSVWVTGAIRGRKRTRKGGDVRPHQLVYYISILSSRKS